jgi:sulfur-carrier protein
MVRLVFLGKFRGLARSALETDLPLDVATLADLKDWIARRDPHLGEAMAATPLQMVLNHEIVRDMAQGVCDGDEVAFLPPMSGG